MGVCLEAKNLLNKLAFKLTSFSNLLFKENIVGAILQKDILLDKKAKLVGTSDK